jgi:hypothetical protein
MTDPKRQWPVSQALPSAVAYADGADKVFQVDLT